jgi:multimeric flavodoxin WrbA
LPWDFMKVLGISTSPRLSSNSDLLLRRALAGASSTGAVAEYLQLYKHNIKPCTACSACYATGECIIDDDFNVVLSKIINAQRLIFATPIYFMSVCAQAKILIDRCQCLWASKYMLKKPVSPIEPNTRFAMAIAVGGTKSKKMFESVRLTMKYYFDALDTGYFANLFVSGVDEAGKIEKNADAMEQAFQLGIRLASSEAAPAQTIEIELT